MARICLIRQFYVPDDRRVARELEALTGAGHSVDVICIRHPDRHRRAPARERHGSLSIHRLPISHRRGRAARYVFEYVAFPLMAAIYLAWLDRRRRFNLVQVNTVPDWLVFAAVVPRMRGVPVLLDLHEVMPEFFVSKFGTAPDHVAIRVLARLEQASIRFASFAITCTQQMREAFISRGAAGDRIAVVMNSSQESVFDPVRYPPRQREPGRFSLISHGTIEERYGVDTIIRAVDRLRGRIPGLTLDVYGDGSCVGELRDLVAELGLQQSVEFHGFAPFDQLLAGIADADAGVVAMKPDVFRDLTHCNKMFDLITMRRPVICSRTKSVMAYFPDGCMQYFEGGDDGDLARAIEELYERADLASQLVANASAANESYRWPHERERYLAVVDVLLTARGTSSIGQGRDGSASYSIGGRDARTPLDSEIAGATRRNGLTPVKEAETK
jgi:glycosyltransferase involved in cell wall biosynthesis